ncbi:hypothetical protein L207DRAFT_465264 [Hyaloscypha variabilis F]|uniref:Uncharacterized protein n=1 Tax=Hyaloscypha variabilis (strain UAMH 11265 / GT02V1 / F) TaxID=1149755 RepID=A0A2J6RBB2_HYAVF|nr:hypothetical protein L207DRAFT_465264 [Hyaloscypha variabilis F]
MAIRYTPEELKHLRESPLVVKPPGLPPVEQWMGPPTDTTRNATKPATDRAKNHDSNALVDQTSRRPGAERHISRNSANPEDIILGPPKTSFMSATSIRNSGKTFDSSDRPSLARDVDSRERFSFRGKTGEGEVEKTRDGRNNTLRPKRAEDQDSDGWSTVKPRKSFGTEGAERFNGRMGVDRHRDDRRFKDREDRDLKDRPRGFETFSRDKDGEDQERDVRRNGTGRGRNEPSWFKDRDNTDGPPGPRDRNSNGDRFSDRKGGWRDKERDDRADRGGGDKTADRGDRRWDRDRDQRQEREPEWMDEPAEDKSQIHTAEDFQKWREQQQRKDKAGKTPIEDVAKPDAGASFFGLDKKVETPLEIVETGPDKFLSKWTAPKDDAGQDTGLEPMEGTARAKTMGKASRFTSFFAPKEEPPRRQTEPPTPVPQSHQGDLSALFGGVQISQNNTQSTDRDDKIAFQQLLMKLKKQPSASGLTPPANISYQPQPPPILEMQQSNPMISPEPFQQYRTERQDDNRSNARNSGQNIHELIVQRQIAGSQPTIRPDQSLQELIGQRQNAASQASSRPDQPPSRNNNTEFLMNLMKSAPDPQRSEQMLLRMPHKPTVDRQMQQQMIEREQEMQREAAQRERSASQRRPQGPPGFFDEAAYQRGPLQVHERQGGNPPQPTQILQRPTGPPPGLDLGWDRQGQLPPQHRLAQNIAPPPGLANGPNRGMPMPQPMIPPGFPMGNFPPQEFMSGPPRNVQMQPPPGFSNYPPPPPGFMPQGMFPGPEGMAFGAPFDGRGPPPQGPFRRQ